MFSDVLKDSFVSTDKTDVEKNFFFIVNCKIFEPNFWLMYKLYVEKEFL